MDPYAFKYEATRQLLSLHGIVRVVCDGRHPDVDLPAHLWENSRVQLYLGRGRVAVVRSIRVHPVVGITGTLVFGGVPYHCLLPWAAVYVVGPHIWSGEVPADARRHFDVPRARRTLQVVPTPPEDGPHAA